MKALIQRVKKACVTVEGEETGRIGEGLLVFLGVCDTDTADLCELLAGKVASLRIFCDEEEKMNRSVLQTAGGILVVSQFTLCADTKKGNRPSFTGAMRPDVANAYYEKFCESLRQNGVKSVETGRFGADMQVELVNDGPVTLMLDTDVWRKKQ